MIFSMILSAVLSQVPSAKIMLAFWLCHVFFFLTVLCLFRSIESSAFIKVWLALGLTALIQVFAFLAAWSLWPSEIRQNHLPAFSHIRHLGYYVAPAAAVMARLYVTQRDRALFALLCFAASVFYLLYTGSRGGAVALASGLMVVCGYLAWHRLRVSPSRVIILLAIVAALALVSALLPQLESWTSLFGRGVQTGAEALSGRDQVWASTVIAIKQNWIWGYGPAILAHIPEYHGGGYNHPHNVFLQLLLHWGLVGSLMITTFLISFAKSVWLAMDSGSALTLLSLSVLAPMAIHSLVDGGLFYPFSTVIAVIAFAQLVAAGIQQECEDAAETS